MDNPYPLPGMKRWIFKRKGEATIVERARLALLLCGVLGLALKLIFSSGTIASRNAAASNPGELSRGTTLSKAAAETVWIPWWQVSVGDQIDRF